jgi:hypothetical protein
MPKQVGWGGLQWIGLDDDVPIGKVLPFRDVVIFWGSGLLLAMVFMLKEVSIGS